jgi:ArsR family transcriptional regulator, arsenate/arsenite/antimonite-responsive transcriptional repressor
VFDVTNNLVTINPVMKPVIAFNHALADATRWRLVQLLFDEPLCVCELADILKMPQSSVSSHIQIIRKAGILDSEKCEKRVYYRVKENFRHLLLSVGGFFDVSPVTDPVLRADARRAVRRLSERDRGCCPLPQSLRKFQPLTAS